ncbi:MAG TPA: maleylpyruvate isomerase family mycothiol-dependent enzyme [Kribbella sp.]|nr:maleylpyruvate isomerase family mycothiol-dependent enzyme [Kribbella sp.]
MPPAELTARLIDELPSATRRLLSTVDRLTDADVRRPSVLPGWTVGHVLSHLARNAEALGNLCEWARTGVRKPMYASTEAREADINAGAARPAAVQAEDIASSSDRLVERFRDMPDTAWQATVRWPSGAARTADQIVTARLMEVEVHHVDLGLGYSLDDVPAESRDVLLQYVVARWPSDLNVVLRSTDTPWSSATSGAGARIVTGGSAALLGWVLGRTDGTALASDGTLPALPAWG